MGSGPRPRAATALALALLGSAAYGEGIATLLSLKPEDSARLDRGEAIVREARDARELSLTAGNERADRLRSRVAALRPNYLSEVIFVTPTREGAIESLTRSLADVKGYVGIKYWSKRNKWNYDLFDKMEIVSRKQLDGGEEIVVVQHMEPFSDYSCRYTYRTKAGPAGLDLSFDCENTSTIAYSYRGIDAVSPGKMLWMLYVFPSEGKTVFYGVGAVRAFDLFGVVRDRLKTSFLGRIEAFFGFMSSRLAGQTAAPPIKENE